MKVTGLSALALPLFASLSSAFLVVDTIHHSEPSILNYNEQKIRLFCNGCPWGGEGSLSDLIFTIKANRNLLYINDIPINANKEVSGSALVTQVGHGHDESEGKMPTLVEFDIDLHEVAHSVDKPVSVNNAHITIKTVDGKIVDLRPLEIIHHVDGVRNGEISILRAHPGRRIACNTTACKIKQTANNGIKAFGFRITVIKGKIMGHAKALKAGCHGNKDSEAVAVHGAHGHGRPHGELMHHGGPHGRPHPDMMHHGRPHHGGPHGHQDGKFRSHHFRGHHHGILSSIAVVLYPIFFGIAAGIFTSLVFVLLYKTFFAVLNAIVPHREERPQPADEQDIEAMGLLVDEKVAYDDEPPMYQDDAPFVVVEKE